ncbi:N-acyl-D-amino-acid deacylase family protein [Wocania ichthyoenteri]|uniref:N-acyl-D-amino-acid deacylase family protein n=1 Tax=Wocania ichthyoenteri TaxID=1230531 RepID=UPI001FCDF9CA|nr:amidohydrolase family protein [Wocania ichthyoenteri]
MILLFVGLFSCNKDIHYDIIIRKGTIYDGLQSEPYISDIGIKDGLIIKIGDLEKKTAKRVIDAKGLEVSPGFINVLSWADLSLLEDGRGMSDLVQGVTTEVFGEGISRGPLNESMQKEWEHPYWKTLGEFLEYSKSKGVTQNIGSMVGATTIRINVLGSDSIVPNKEELNKMKNLVEQSMLEGALGLSSALIYTPANYASTEELIELAKIVSNYGGIYTSHIRSEGNDFESAVNEFIEVVEKANIRGEIYHLKAAGKTNWNKLDHVIKKIDSANANGLKITTDMYAYTAAATGLNACMPPWVKKGGFDEWLNRLKDKNLRHLILKEIRSVNGEWENFFTAVGDPEKILVTGFKEESLKQYTGKSLLEISKSLNLSPEETIVELIIRNKEDVNAVYFLMSEENVKKKIKLPYMTFCSDSYAVAPEGDALNSNPHPRAYGNFSRLLGKYVRDEKVISLEEAIGKLTLSPAINFGIEKRGAILEGWHADVLVFDLDEINDKATYANPHQYSTGMKNVIINGKMALDDGKHQNIFPGEIIRGPGYNKNKIKYK